MARTDLKPWTRWPGGWRLLLAIVVLVLVGHALVLDRIGRIAAQQSSALRKMAEPMFTRMLEPVAPPEPPRAVARAAPRPVRPRRPVAPPAPSPAAEMAQEAASAPEVVASAAEGTPPVPPEPSPTVQPGPSPTARPEPSPTVRPELVEGQAQASTSSARTEGADAAKAAPGDPPRTSADTSPPRANTEALAPWPRDTRLNYALTGQYRSGPLYGNAQVQWQREGADYQVRITLEISLAGSRVMTSQGKVTPDGLLPRVYEETRGNHRRIVRLMDEMLLFENGQTAPRPAGVQDTASQFVELGHRFASGQEPLRLGHSVQLWLARPGSVDLWTYDVVQEELLRTPRHGEIAAFRLKPRPIANPRGNITAEIWYAPSLQYLPVRIRVSMGEEAWVDLMVDVVEQR